MKAVLTMFALYGLGAVTAIAVPIFAQSFDEVQMEETTASSIQQNGTSTGDIARETHRKEIKQQEETDQMILRLTEIDSTLKRIEKKLR